MSDIISTLQPPARLTPPPSSHLEDGCLDVPLRVFLLVLQAVLVHVLGVEVLGLGSADCALLLQLRLENAS